jgi:hypothetical protein
MREIASFVLFLCPRKKKERGNVVVSSSSRVAYERAAPAMGRDKTLFQLSKMGEKVFPLSSSSLHFACRGVGQRQGKMGD